MKKILEKLKSACGTYEGESMNHEGETFIGKFKLSETLDGRGFEVLFSAAGKDGKIFHREHSMIASSLDEKLVLWNFNTNTPGLVPHELRSSATKPETANSFTFGFHQPSDTQKFREEVVLDIHCPHEISYSYSWGLPGGEFKERSGVRMKKVTNTALSPRMLLEKYQVEINKHDFNLIEPLISKDCKFWFSSGTFVGLEQTRQAFEKTWGLIKDEVYTLSDVEWIAESEQATVCTYTFHWKGLIDSQPREGNGRGTSCFRYEEKDGWKIVHEHLSNFPK